jgi:hypothetical protein
MLNAKKKSCTKINAVFLWRAQNTHDLPEGQTPEICTDHVLDMYTQSHLAKNTLQLLKFKQASSWYC